MDKVSCSRTQHTDSTAGEAQSSNIYISIVVALDETEDFSLLHFSNQNIEQSQNYFSYFSTKRYVVGIQKNPLTRVPTEIQSMTI